MNSAQRVKGWPGSLSKKCTNTGDAGLSRQASGLLAGVVSGLLVVRSVLAKQLTSAIRLPRALRTSSQLTPARTENGTRSSSKTAERIVGNIVFSLRV